MANNGNRGTGSPNPVVYGRDLMNAMLADQELTKQAHPANMRGHNATQHVVKADGQSTRDAVNRGHNATQHVIKADGQATRTEIGNAETRVVNHIDSVFGFKKPLWWLIVCIFGAIAFTMLIYWYFEMSGIVHLESLGYWDYLRDAAGNAISDDMTQWIVDNGMKPVVAIGGAIVSGSLWTLLYNIIPFKRGGVN